MKTRKKRNTAIRFIVLIPHRDAGKLLEEYRLSLFAAGFYGAFSFPPCAPLAVVSAPFRGEELKALAFSARKHSGQSGGKFSCSETALSSAFDYPLPAAEQRTPDSGAEGKPGLSFFGPRLDLPAGDELFPECGRAKIIRVISPAVLCAALALREENPAPCGEAPPISFRAAAVANMVLRPLKEGPPLSFEWRTGAPVWLPAYKKKEPLVSKDRE